MSLFNTESLFEIDLLYDEGIPVDKVVDGIKETLKARHGKEDVTITTQQQMLDVLGSVLDVLTFAVGAIGGISLLVGAIGIITIMEIMVIMATANGSHTGIRARFTMNHIMKVGTRDLSALVI